MTNYVSFFKVLILCVSFCENLAIYFHMFVLFLKSGIL